MHRVDAHNHHPAVALFPMVVSKSRVYNQEKGEWHEVEHAPDEKTRKKMVSGRPPHFPVEWHIARGVTHAALMQNSLLLPTLPQEKQREKETQNALRREKLSDMQYLQVYRR